MCCQNRIFIKVFFCLLICSSLRVDAQIIKNNTINRGIVDETQRDSSGFWVFNNSFDDLKIESILTNTIYGDTVLRFNINDSSISVGDSSFISLSFTPKHNIEHIIPIILKTSHDEGAFGLEFEAQVHYSKTYYSSTQNLTESSLRSTLNNIISSNHNVLSYNIARDNMYATLDNHGGLVQCVYTGRSASFNTRSGAVANNMNCEHTFPQSMYSSSPPMKNDIHHLFPSDQSANSSRSNHPFGVVTGTPNWSVGGSKRQGNVFEPRNEHKGDCARAMLYFVLRYGDYSNFFSPQETTLRAWHNDYPIDSLDEYRNDGVYGLQGNRNPFVDYPQFIDRISTLIGPTSAQIKTNFIVSEDTITLVNRNPGSQISRRLIIANSGNVPLLFSNMNISNSGINIISGGSPKSLEPGEQYSVLLEYNSSNIYSNDSLTFQISSVSSMNTASLPIRSKAKMGLRELSSTDKYVVPLSEGLRFFNISGEETFQLFDFNGRLLAKKSLSQGPEDSYDWLISCPTSGWVRILRNGKVSICKFVK
tara:strand:- start:98 stop:1699 length:1602 start_codon:yes stop_codon:yes gene_type:complete